MESSNSVSSALISSMSSDCEKKKRKRVLLNTIIAWREWKWKRTKGKTFNIIITALKGKVGHKKGYGQALIGNKNTTIQSAFFFWPLVQFVYLYNQCSMQFYSLF